MSNQTDRGMTVDSPGAAVALYDDLRLMELDEIQRVLVHMLEKLLGRERFMELFHEAAREVYPPRSK